MLEIPESYTIARQMKETLVGKEITHVEAAQSKHGFACYWGEPAGYEDMLVGKVIDDAYSVGGIVELAAGEIRIAFNDGINIRYLQPEQALPKKHQLYVGFADGSGFVCTVTMYGGMMVFPAGLYDNFYYQVHWEKPTPLREDFSEDHFAKIVAEAGDKASVKTLLATGQRIPGLGNGCLQDICYQAGINPQSRLGALPEGALERTYRSVKDTLAEMTEGGGRDTEKDFFGINGSYACNLSKKTQPYPCLCCGCGIVRKAYMGGNIYYCPQCQPILK